MYALRAYLEDDFFAFAAAHNVPPNRRQRARIAQQLLNAFDKGLDAITDQVHRISGDFRGVPNSIVYDWGGKSHLARPLRSLTRTMIQDIQGRVSRSVALEEVHTVLDLLMASSLGRDAKRLSFAEKVGALEARGFLDASEARDLNKLKDYRRDAKHRGQGFDESEASRLIVEGNQAIQKLLTLVRSDTVSRGA
jgi:hypothetical protein